jgi:hypothetical protein
VQRRIEGTLTDVERCARELMEPLRDRPAVLRFVRDGFQDQEIQSALRKVHSIGRHVLPFCFDRRKIAALLSECNGEDRREADAPTPSDVIK